MDTLLKNPTPRQLHRLIQAEVLGVRILHFPDGTVYAWPAAVSDHYGVASLVGMTHGVRILIIGTALVVRPIDTEDRPLSEEDALEAFRNPRLAFLLRWLQDGSLTLETNEY